MSTAPDCASARLAEIWARLAEVVDPELDESVTELGFVTTVDVHGGRVSIGFRLPTYWCAANFAYLMADDMRRAVSAAAWVTDVAITLDEHMYAAAINRGLAAGASFRQTFGSEADDDVEDVRRVFLVKAFQRRQEALLSRLLAQGHEPRVLLDMSIAQLSAWIETTRTDDALRRLLERYRERRWVVGASGNQQERTDADLAFVDAEGAPLDAATLGGYLRALRTVGVNVDFNGALCRGLLAARYGEGCATPPAIEAKPVRFVRAANLAQPK